jgi:hypothetical protein
MTIKLIERIKGLRILRRFKPRRESPVLSWESLDQDAGEQFIEEAMQEAREQIEALNEALRSQN